MNISEQWGSPDPEKHSAEDVKLHRKHVVEYLRTEPEQGKRAYGELQLPSGSVCAVGMLLQKFDLPVDHLGCVELSKMLGQYDLINITTMNDSFTLRGAVQIPRWSWAEIGDSMERKWRDQESELK